MNKKNIVYITLLCVCFALDVVALALSFCLNRFFGVLTSSKCAEYEAVVSEIDTSDADMVHIFVIDAKVWDSKAEADQEEEQAAEEPQKGVSCTVLVAMHDVDADKLNTLAAGKGIVFLVEEGELSEGGCRRAQSAHFAERYRGRKRRHARSSQPRKVAESQARADRSPLRRARVPRGGRLLHDQALLEEIALVISL